METTDAVQKLTALASEPRLAIFRLLVRNGTTPLNATRISEHTGIPKSTLSFHLKELHRAGLVTNTKQSRFHFYALDTEGMSSLLGYLTEDCCQGRPELCNKNKSCR